MAKNKIFMSVTATAFITSIAMVPHSSDAISLSDKPKEAEWVASVKHDLKVKSIDAEKVIKVRAAVDKKKDIVLPDNIDESTTYEVQSGDTLSEIAYKLDVDTQDLMKWNNLDSTLIFPGQELVLKEGTEVVKEDNQPAEKAEPQKEELEIVEVAEAPAPAPTPAPAPAPAPAPEPVQEDVQAEQQAEEERLAEEQAAAEAKAEEERQAEAQAAAQAEEERLAEEQAQAEAEAEEQRQAEEQAAAEVEAIAEEERQAEEQAAAKEAATEEEQVDEPAPAEEEVRAEEQSNNISQASVATMSVSAQDNNAQAEQKEQERIAKEKAEKAEQERIAREKAQKEEQERIAREKAQKEVQNRIAAEKAQKEKEQKQQQAQSQGVSGDLISTAKSVMGTPYVWGGSQPGGFDCSGFIHWAHKASGNDIGRTSTDGYYNKSYIVDNPQVGDLVFFEGTYRSGISHMGIYLGNGQMIHAGTSSGVTIASVHGPYWGKHFHSYKRFY